MLRVRRMRQKKKNRKNSNKIPINLRQLRESRRFDGSSVWTKSRSAEHLDLIWRPIPGCSILSANVMPPPLKQRRAAITQEDFPLTSQVAGAPRVKARVSF